MTVYSIAVLQDVPKLVRGMAVHGIKSGVPENQRANFLLVYKGEQELKQAVAFERADDAYVVALGAGGDVRRGLHGPVTEEAVKQVVTP